MTTPYQELLQRFGVTITKRDLQRKVPSWSRLNEMFILGLSDQELKKLILVELNGKKRREILSRLCARLKTQELKQLRELVFECIK